MAKSSMLDGPVDIEDLEQDGVDLVIFFSNFNKGGEKN